jgi:hypothetical protein
MQTDRIAQLLSEADADQPSPPLHDDLARRVRRRRARHRAVRGATALLLIVTIGALSVRMLSTPRPTPIAVAPPDPAQLRLQCARLDNQAVLYERVADLILLNERAAATSRTLSLEASADDPADVQLERSALILLRQGSRLMEHPQTKDQAVGLYRQIVRLFPRTRGGQQAKKKLDEISSNSAAWRKEQS